MTLESVYIRPFPFFSAPAHPTPTPFYFQRFGSSGRSFLRVMRFVLGALSALARKSGSHRG